MNNPRHHALHRLYRERMDSLTHAVLAEHGIKVSSTERKRLVDLALNFDDEAPLNALVAEIAPRARDIRELDQEIASAKSKLAALDEIAAPLRKLAGYPELT